MQTILLAAGLATRSGGEKLLYLYQGKAIIYHSLAASLNANLPTTLVTGYRAKEVLEAIAPLRSPLLTVVHNSSFELGQGTSVRTATRALDRDTPFFIALGDMPLLQPEHYRSLINAYEGGVLRPKVGKELGHPVLLDSSFIDIINKKEGAFRMQDLLAPYPLSYFKSEEEAFIRDVDTDASYQALIEQ